MAVPEANPDANQERQRRQRELLAELKTANAALADSSWALAELEQQIEQLAAAENSAAPPVARRIADLRRWRVALEERTLRHMLRADAISAELAALP